MNFKEYITELFDSYYKWLGHNYKDYYEAKFMTKAGHFIHVDIVQHNIKGEFHLVFGSTSEEEKDMYSDYTEDITGKGDAYKILSTVVEITKAFIKLHPEANSIIFTSKSDEPSRTSLYKKLGKKVADSLAWDITYSNTNYETIFKVTKR